MLLVLFRFYKLEFLYNLQEVSCSKKRFPKMEISQIENSEIL